MALVVSDRGHPRRCWTNHPNPWGRTLLGPELASPESGPACSSQMRTAKRKFDRVVLNPRTRLCSLRDAEGNVFDTFRLSLEVCGCGYSFARAGVGYRGSDGWYCKRCGQLHTLDGKPSASDPARLKPDSSRVREFDVGIRVSPDWSTPSDLETGTGQQRKGGVNARQETGSKGQGTRGQGGRIHPAAQAADDSGRGRGAAVRAARDD